MRWLKPGLDLMADLLFPRACGICARNLFDGEQAWCRACAEKLMAAQKDEFCPRCGRTVGPYDAGPSGCASCVDQGSRLKGITRVGAYQGSLRELIHRFKFGRHQELIGSLGWLLHQRLQSVPWLERIDALVPVPVGIWSRVRYHGSPPLLIARELGKHLRRPVYPLVRLKFRAKRQSQRNLPHSQRWDNVRGVFVLRREARVEGARLCVVDDVSTSGATLQEVGKVLRRAGAAEVYGAVIAKANPSEVGLVDA